MVCNVSDERLQLWLDRDALDGSALSRHELDEIDDHVAACAECAARVERYVEAGRELRGMIQAGLQGGGKSGMPPVEPLRAVQAIHQRIAEHRQRSWAHRAMLRAADLWTFERRKKVMGLMVAAAISAVVGPAVVQVLDHNRSTYTVGALHEGSPHPAMASVVVESLEFDGQSRAMIYRPAANTTVIWLESEDRHHGKEF